MDGTYSKLGYVSHNCRSINAAISQITDSLQKYRGIPTKGKVEQDHQKIFFTTHICLEIAKTQGKISMARCQGYFNEFGLHRIASNREFVFRNVLRAVKQSSRISYNKELVFRTCPKGSEWVKQNFI